MNGAFLRREWGAVTFVLTVVVGLIVVPLALFLTNQGPSNVTLPSTHVSSPRITTPSPKTTPTASPKTTPKASPKATPTPTPKKTPSPSP